LRKPQKNPLHEELLRKRIAEIKSQITVGGLREAAVRALLYVGMGRGAVDERTFEAIRRIRREHRELPVLPLPDFKALVREQFLMLLIDQDGALAAVPTMLPGDPDKRRQTFGLVQRVLSARGELDAEDLARMARIAGLFGVNEQAAKGAKLVTLPSAGSDMQTKAS
jgi:hypothetical protein